MNIPGYYNFAFKGVKLDPYRILEVYGITRPAQQHAIKKLLRAGCSSKTYRQDVEEAIQSLHRLLEMDDEESVLSKVADAQDRIDEQFAEHNGLTP